MATKTDNKEIKKSFYHHSAMIKFDAFKGIGVIASDQDL